jgi:hypothetical protein
MECQFSCRSSNSVKNLPGFTGIGLKRQAPRSVVDRMTAILASLFWLRGCDGHPLPVVMRAHEDASHAS